MFLYFLPQDETVDGAGLGYAFDGRAPARRGCERGPGNQRGVVLAYPADGIDGIGYFPDAQTWSRIPGSPAWLGYATLPAPDALSRATEIGRYLLPLGDGARWLVPTAMTPDDTGARGESPLPKVRRLREDGSIERRVAPAYESLYLLADEVWESLETGTPLDDTREYEVAVAALAANYRVGPAEVSALGLLTDEGLALIFSALCNTPAWPRFRAALED